MLDLDPNIRSFKFYKYPSQVLLQDTIQIGKVESEQLASALLHRNATKLPFWDSIMLTFFNRKDFSLEILKAATRHNQNKETIETKDIPLIRKTIESNHSINLSINSSISVGNEKYHIFLLDFHIPPSDNNLQVVINILKILDVNGHILNSGKSYHFVGKDYFTEEQTITLLAKALLFAPIVDRAWIGHQILERSCSIRVGYKHDKLPVLVAEV